ncbi:ATP-binding protein [Peribacillus frigoritolerans]|uniref:ATP-binding protein n=1 Tax=Peribacillus frigoritolerans TaxID=450367 RepID=UPI003800C100
MNHENKEIKTKNDLICKKYLDKESEIIVQEIEGTEELSFFRIKGLTNFWESEEKIDFHSIMTDLISGIYHVNLTFVYALVGKKNEVRYILGIDTAYQHVMENSLRSAYPYIELEPLEMKAMSTEISHISQYGGIVTGYPTNKINGEKETLQIERLYKGLYGEEWSYLVVAKGFNSFLAARTHERLLDELDEVSQNAKKTMSGGSYGSESWEMTNLFNQRYVENLELLEKRIHEGTTNGLWRMNAYYMSPDSKTAQKMGSLVTSVFSGEESKPEKIRTIPVKNIREMVHRFPLIGHHLDEEEKKIHPLGMWKKNPTDKVYIQSFQYRYQTILTSHDLATLCQIPRKELPGYYINPYVEFETSDRRQGCDFEIGNIVNGNDELKQNPYKMDLEDLNRHGLIVGMTGGGKSNTSKNLLTLLWKKHHIPFMVIESAKREYWELANFDGFDDLLVFTLGAEDENSVPFRINPFEKIGNIPLQTHIDYLLSTFKASFELYPPMPYVLETAVYRIYEDIGWDVLENTCIHPVPQYPTLEDLYNKIDIIVDELGYDQRLKSDITAALKARVHSLRVGGKGAMLDTHFSINMGKLLSRPVVLELEDIGDDDVKAFVMGIVLVHLYEYRKDLLSKQKGSSKKFDHLILIEEAHRLLANIGQGGEGANPRAKAVEFFTNLLAEIRSYGQGFFIADQVPTKLAPDTLKNTNLKIVHRIVMQEDRECIGHSMNMTQEQINYISTLKRGYAAVYSEGDVRPKLVKMPLVKIGTEKSRSEIIASMQQSVKAMVQDTLKPKNAGMLCTFCLGQCEHQNYMEEIYDLIKRQNWESFVLEEASQFQYSPHSFDRFYNKLEEDGYFDSISVETRLCTTNRLIRQTGMEESEKRKNILNYMYYQIQRAKN